MNRDRVIQLADAIENNSIPDLGFNMEYYIALPDDTNNIADRSGNNCNTVACIGGWIAHIAEPTSVESFRDAGEWLDLHFMEANKLFYADGIGFDHHGIPLEEITPQDAVKVLRNLAETGNVDWSIIDGQQ